MNTLANLTPNKRRSIKNYLAINALALLFLLIGEGFVKLTGWPYIAVLPGLIGFFLPALNLALCFEWLTQFRERTSTIILWTFVLGVTVVPGVIDLGSRMALYGHQISPFEAFGTLWLASVISLIALLLIQKNDIEPVQLNYPKEVIKEVLVVVALFVTIMGLNFLIYPYVPEADSYTYLLILQKAAHASSQVAVDPRSTFLALVSFLSSLTRVDPYWLFKLVIPMFGIFNVLAVYLFARRSIERPFWRILAALSPLSFPVILQESLITRPQVIMIFCLLPVIYLVEKITEERRSPRQIYWLLALMIVGVIGMKIHFLFVNILMLALLSGALVAWPFIKRHPTDSIVIAIISGALISARISLGRTVGDIWHILQLFGHTISQGHFRAWFLSNYDNVDGNETGWPGLTAVYYYGYSLGISWLTILGVAIAKKVKVLPLLFSRKRWALLLIAALFFFVAEIAPRFGIAYLPDRAWLLIALTMAMMYPLILAAIKPETRSKLIVGLIIASQIGSILIGTAVTYAKQGWVTKEEVVAARYIQAETPANAIFLGQGGMRMSVRYFGQRTFVKSPPEVFLGDNQQALEEYLSAQVQLYAKAVQNYSITREGLGTQIAQLAQKIADQKDTSDKNILARQLGDLVAQLGGSLDARQALTDSFPTVNAPVYLIYSTDKFNSIYSWRGWWRATNFYGANLAKLTARYPVVYNQDGVTIWKVGH